MADLTPASRLPVVLLAALLTLLAPAAPGQATARYLFKGTRHAPDALPETVPADLREAAVFWAPLAEALKLRGYLGSDGAFGLLYTSRVPSASAIHKTADKVDTLFEKAWGRGSGRKPAMIVVLDRQEDVGAVLDHLVPSYPYLTEWAKTARSAPGITLYDPPLYVVVDDRDPKSEFRLANQIVHQQALLILYGEFKALPFWVQEGFAWVAEDKLCGRIHAFNNRAGFVSGKEHTGWQAAVRKLAKSNPDPKRLLQTDPAGYDRDLSLLAFGFARYLLERDDRGRAVLARLGEAWAEKSKDGTEPDVRLTPEEQEAALTEVLGADWPGAFLAFLK